MESLQVRTGVIALQILDDFGDVRGIFRFNPEDIESARKILALQKDLQVREKEYKDKADKAISAEDTLELLDEITVYFNTSIDECFGKGSSEVLFGGAKSLTMYADFFEGLIPYYEKASKKRMDKYKVKSGK